MTLPKNLRKTRAGWSIRVRIGAAGRPWLPMPAMSEDDALSRLERVQKLAEEFVRAGKAAEAERVLRDTAEAPTAKVFDVAVRAAKRLLVESGVEPAGPKTFRDVAEMWTSGDLHRAYPDDVPPKTESGRKIDRAILSAFYPLLGHKPMTEITTADTDAAKLVIPKSVKEDSTRAVYLTRLRSVFKFAVDPLALIAAPPLRGKFVPRRKHGRDFWFLYPSEARLLLGCIEVPFEYRFLYGFLCHNGTRISETLRLTWAHVDWTTSVVRLDKSWTKTKRGRTWKLDPDVLRALRLRFEQLGKPTEGLVFVRADGEALSPKRVDDRFIGDLRLAGISRPELLATTVDGRRLRPHDLRATFVTIARKVGRRMADGVEIVMTDRWIMDRTGHETLGVLGKYERMVRHAAELDLGWFAPLDETLYPQASGPGVAWTKGGPKVDQNAETSIKKAASGSRTWSAHGSHAPRKKPNSAAASRSNDTGQRLGPPLEGGVDQKIQVRDTNPGTAAGTPPGLSEDTLRRLLELATRAKEWGVVRELSAALETLAAQAAPNVTRLDDRRRK